MINFKKANNSVQETTVKTSPISNVAHEVEKKMSQIEQKNSFVFLLQIFLLMTLFSIYNFFFSIKNQQTLHAITSLQLISKIYYASLLSLSTFVIYLILHNKRNIIKFCEVVISIANFLMIAGILLSLFEPLPLDLYRIMTMLILLISAALFNTNSKSFLDTFTSKKDHKKKAWFLSKKIKN